MFVQARDITVIIAALFSLAISAPGRADDAPTPGADASAGADGASADAAGKGMDAAPADGVAKSVTDAPAQAPVTATQATGELQWATPFHDFGSVKRGTVVEKTFAFTNVGRGPLTIHGVHASCGCTTSEADVGRQYQAGEKGEIVIKLDTSHFRGPLVKTVTVMTNAKVLPDKLLTLKATVVEELSVNPPVLDFGETSAEAPVSKTVRVEAVGGVTAQVTGLRFDKGKLNAALKPAKAGWDVEVTLLPGAPAGFLAETIVVENTSTSMKEIPILVRGHVLPNLSHAPTYLEFGPIGQSQRAVRSLAVAGRRAFAFKGARTELNVNGKAVPDPDRYIKVTFPKERSDKARDLAIELLNAQGLAGSVHGRLTLETDDPGQKDLSVDFYAFFQE